MYYTGIDLHRKTSFVTTVDQSGQIVKKINLINDEVTILDYFLSLDDDTKVVIESTANWYWLYDLLTEHSIPVVVSNPVKTKAIASARIKNDKLDSHMLAQLLRADLLATVHVSSKQTRELKELLRFERSYGSRKTASTTLCILSASVICLAGVGLSICLASGNSGIKLPFNTLPAAERTYRRFNQTNQTARCRQSIGPAAHDHTGSRTDYLHVHGC
jgi:transposase